jgi:hypothetical protein
MHLEIISKVSKFKSIEIVFFIEGTNIVVKNSKKWRASPEEICNVVFASQNQRRF